MKKIYLLLLSLFSGLLISIAWPRDGFVGLMFVAFIPMLFVEDFISKNRKRFRRFSVFVYTYPGFLLWNVLTTWWIYNSTEGGAIGAVVANSFFMAVVFQIYSFTKKHVYGRGHGYFVLPFLWMSFEYWHLNWDMSWPWLNLGNAFSSFPEWVQWYEYTGAFGGTFWILIVNILFYRFLIVNKEALLAKRNKIIWGGLGVFMLFVPLFLSLIMYSTYKEEYRPVEVIVTQPNINPYTEQYNTPPLEILDKNLMLAKPLITDKTAFLVCPESSIQERIWEDHLGASPSLNALKRLVKQHPDLGIFIGASTYKGYEKEEEVPYTARKYIDADGYYDAYNTVVFIDTATLDVYHKSKLTPMVEKVPLAAYFNLEDVLAIDLGGVVGTLATDEIRKVFITQDDSLRVAAAICYESIYGEFFARFARNGAELIFIVTNDGWWGNTAGHRQHFAFARLRAVETRRCIARSANTGISAFINQRGDVLQESEYWVPAVLKENLNANDKITFYSRYGNFIARISAFVSVMLLLIAISMGLRNRKKLPVS